MSLSTVPISLFWTFDSLATLLCLSEFCFFHALGSVLARHHHGGVHGVSRLGRIEVLTNMRQLTLTNANFMVLNKRFEMLFEKLGG